MTSTAKMKIILCNAIVHYGDKCFIFKNIASVTMIILCKNIDSIWAALELGEELMGWGGRRMGVFLTSYANNTW